MGPGAAGGELPIWTPGLRQLHYSPCGGGSTALIPGTQHSTQAEGKADPGSRLEGAVGKITQPSGKASP